MKFNGYITEGANTWATNMELSVVEAWMGKPLTFEEQREAAENIVRSLKEGVNAAGIKFTGKSAKHLGDGDVKATAEWLKYFKSKTPKTDIILDGHKLSLKRKGASQLVSAGRSETRAIFNIVSDRMNMHEDTFKEVETVIESMINVQAEHSVTALRRKRKPEIPIKELDKVNAHLTELIKGIYENSVEFRNGIIEEAATGIGKFGGNDGTANNIMVWENDGVSSLHKIFDGSGNPTAHIKDIAARAGVRFSWKSIGAKKRYSLYSSFRIDIKEWEEFDAQMVNEGVTDLFTKIKRFLLGAWARIKKFIQESTANLMEFLGIQPNLDIKHTF